MRRPIKKTVYKILSNEPYSRENDGYLIMRVIQELEPAMFKNDFEEVMQNLQVKGISFEGITRARRKFFEENPQLRIKKAEEARRKKEEEYFLEYAGDFFHCLYSCQNLGEIRELAKVMLFQEQVL